jgi:hypothetical protein
MQTYEATMHRVDAELTAGLPIGPITRDVAAGAIDHAVDVMWGWMPDGARYRPHGVVELVAADTDQTWRLECGGFSARGRDGSVVDGPTARRAVTGAPTASVTGPVVDLARWAWTRGGRVRIAGDESTVSALNAVVTQGMP